MKKIFFLTFSFLLAIVSWGQNDNSFNKTAAFQLVKADISIIRNKGKLLDSIGKKELAQVEYNKINTFYNLKDNKFV